MRGKERNFFSVYQSLFSLCELCEKKPTSLKTPEKKAIDWLFAYMKLIFFAPYLPRWVR